MLFSISLTIMSRSSPIRQLCTGTQPGRRNGKYAILDSHASLHRSADKRAVCLRVNVCIYVSAAMLVCVRCVHLCEEYSCCGVIRR